LGTAQPIIPKYVVRTSFEVEGVVEKSDVIGALFGQTEGLFGPELDLHELQKSGRIGRIEISMETKKDKTFGVITIPSSLDKPLTALIAAAVENVDRVGPCAAKVALDRIEDVREVKRAAIVSRAKAILQEWTVETTSTVDRLAEEIYGSVVPAEIVPYGPDKLEAGPEVEKSPSIIVVEGRADVSNLLRSGVKNAVACQGTTIPNSLVKLTKEKEVTVLLDGDRGGDIILEALLQVANVKYIARAPRGKEVEELTPKQVLKTLSEKVPAVKPVEEKAKPTPIEREKPTRKPITVPDKIASTVSELRGTLEAIVLNESLKPVDRMPVSELAVKLQQIDGATVLVFDGIITQRLVDIAEDKGLKQIIGERISGVAKRPVNIQLLTLDEVAPEEAKAVKP